MTQTEFLTYTDDGTPQVREVLPHLRHRFTDPESAAQAAGLPGLNKQLKEVHDLLMAETKERCLTAAELAKLMPGDFTKNRYIVSRRLPELRAQERAINPKYWKFNKKKGKAEEKRYIRKCAVQGRSSVVWSAWASTVSRLENYLAGVKAGVKEGVNV